VAPAAQAQTYSFANVYSTWTPWDTRLKFSNFVALLDANDVELNRVASDTLLSTSTVSVSFPPQAGDVVVAKVKAGFTQVGTTQGVTDLVGGWSVTFTLSQSFPVPSGAVTTLAYTSMSLTPKLIATVVAAAPPPPPPPAPVPSGDSQLGDCAPPLAQLTLLGAVWTVGAGKVFRNGVWMSANAYSDLASICVSGNPPNIRAVSPSHGYECWGTTSWVGTGC